ncbi:uncharacterized protein [Phyllobates terribilis]|uniref:uncharacterized protein isoform X4 n=1 Tax=Phyllobates terribilis TaxID=111132 RepID=UPI003CCB27E7
MCVSSASPCTMSEGWVDWPILGPGWKRRTVVRKSGASSGQSDTYYQSPVGQRFRSRNELAKYLGDAVDLSRFDFKSGALLPADQRKPLRKYSRKHPKCTANSQAKKKQELPPPVEPDQDLQNGKDEEPSHIACCSGCHEWFTGVEFGKSKQTGWYCGDCRASRRAYNKQLKTSGCGSCTACRLTENCGHCSVCLLRSQNPEFGSSWKCVRRRCLQVIRKGGVCGRCPGCCMKEDCGTCAVCVSKEQNLKEASDKKCLRRWCHNKKQKIKPPMFKKLTKKLNLRGNCGHCPGCCTAENCGVCSLCIRRMQNPGRKIKGKCVRRRCHNKKKKIKVKPRLGMKGQCLDEDVELLPPKIPVIRLALKNGGYPSADGTRGGWVIGGMDTKEVEEEIISVIDDDDDEQPLDLHCPVKSEEFMVEDDDVMLADDNTPVIMEIYSLGSYARNDLDPLLQEFMDELNEIPLPAHWEVLAPTGPTLHLIQRSGASTMAETIIHILPGLHFNIAVRNYPVPSSHELFSKHPNRLTTVDEVVELICDLEAYRPCGGLPKSGPPSPNCLVLVYEERCPECCTMPWPSGIYH